MLLLYNIFEIKFIDATIWNFVESRDIHLGTQPQTTTGTDREPTIFFSQIEKIYNFMHLGIFLSSFVLIKYLTYCRKSNSDTLGSVPLFVQVVAYLWVNLADLKPTSPRLSRHTQPVAHRPLSWLPFRPYPKQPPHLNVTELQVLQTNKPMIK